MAQALQRLITTQPNAFAPVGNSINADLEAEIDGLLEANKKAKATGMYLVHCQGASKGGQQSKTVSTLCELVLGWSPARLAIVQSLV